MTLTQQTRTRIHSAALSVHEERSAASRRHTRAASAAPGTPEAIAAGRGLPAVDPSSAFGCVDWFLYPEPERDHINR